MAETCGAKTRSGAPCKSRQMANGRCRMHGGTSTGPKDATGNSNAVTHGIYRARLTPAEQEQYGLIEVGNVDHELRLMRIRLARALSAETQSQGNPEIEEITENEGGGVAVPRRSEKKKVRDYIGIIDKLTGRIESLERTRAFLMPEAPPGGEDEDITRNDTTIKPDGPIPSKPIL